MKLQKRKTSERLDVTCEIVQNLLKWKLHLLVDLYFVFGRGRGKEERKEKEKKIELKKEGAWTIAVFLHRVSTFCLSPATQVWSRCRLNFRGLLSLLAPIDRWVNGNWLDALSREDKKISRWQIKDHLVKACRKQLQVAGKINLINLWLKPV